jgi:hypothetical protein
MYIWRNALSFSFLYDRVRISVKLDTYWNGWKRRKTKFSRKIISWKNVCVLKKLNVRYWKCVLTRQCSIDPFREGRVRRFPVIYRLAKLYNSRARKYVAKMRPEIIAREKRKQEENFINHCTWQFYPAFSHPAKKFERNPYTYSDVDELW